MRKVFHDDTISGDKREVGCKGNPKKSLFVLTPLNIPRWYINSKPNIAVLFTIPPLYLPVQAGFKNLPQNRVFLSLWALSVSCLPTRALPGAPLYPSVPGMPFLVYPSTCVLLHFLLSSLYRQVTNCCLYSKFTLAAVFTPEGNRPHARFSA